MAKSKSRSRGCCPASPTSGSTKHHHLPGCCHSKSSKSPCCNNSNVELTQEAIDRHWSALPPAAKKFILDMARDTQPCPVQRLLDFWSAPGNVECTQGGIAGSLCGATWYLALVYIRLNMIREACALTVNGAFLHQCYNTSIEYFKSVATGGAANFFCSNKLPYFVRGANSTSSPESMKRYIETYLPKEYTQMMTSFANLSNSKNVRSYVDQIGNDWKQGARKPRSSSQSDESEEQVEIVLVDDANQDDRQSFDIGASTTLKSLFNDYADRRGVSLRSLRFSHDGKTLFLSSAGNKTPSQLGLSDGAVITVHDTTAESSSDDDSNHQGQATSKKGKAKKSKSKKGKGKRKKAQPQQQQQHVEPEKTLEEYKVDHSKQLTKLHEEAADKFKSIRQRLNNLQLERRSPKVKSKRPRSPKLEPTTPKALDCLPKAGLGGKAGKSHYLIQVGEVGNLYKTTKPQHQSSNAAMPTLDLHGCTSEEAISKLDASLEAWVDSAMRGSYPFVQPAVIVCGCGNQILSQVVQDWIKENDRVSNAPRRRAFASRAA